MFSIICCYCCLLLGLDRGGWTVSSKVDEEPHYNGETDDSSATDSPQQVEESPGTSFQDRNTILPLNKDQIEQLSSPYAGHRDDMALLRGLVPDLPPEQRPRSLAVAWLTTANSLQQKPPSPVMSMSPQAAYMSKIIPNAVLPPSIDVVEISRGRSRNSVRTVSKASLLMPSPATSRPSSRACSSRASTLNPPNHSDSSCWSNSSETLVSDSSTVSSSTTPRQTRSPDGDGTLKADKNTSKSSQCTSNGKIIVKGDGLKKDGQFVRSLSVMKPKKAPPPPNRSHSLYNKMKRRSRDMTGVSSGEPSVRIISVEEKEKNKYGSSPVPSTITDCPGYNADTSSLDDSGSLSPMRSQMQALKAEEAARVEQTVSKDSSQKKKEPLPSKIVSPSSGYSSQDGTSKLTHSSSSRHKSGILAKLRKVFPGSTPAILPPLTVPEDPENTKSDISVDTVSVSPSVRALIELFNIPPPPKVHAPPPPPPEVWAHNKRTFELLLGPPAPDNTYAIIKKNPKDRRQQRKCTSSSVDGSVKSFVEDRKHKYPFGIVESINRSLPQLETKKVQESVILNAEIHKEHSDRLAVQNAELTGNGKVTETDKKVRVSDLLNGMLVKAVERREERLVAGRKEETTQATEINTNSARLPAISLVGSSPSPSPLVHHASKPPIKQTAAFVPVTSEPVSPELSWPPPPPPMRLGGPDDFVFPAPPPPIYVEGLVVAANVPAEKSKPGSNSSCMSGLPVVKKDCVRLTTEVESQKPNKSQGNIHLLLKIPPPPSYTAPPPPVKAVSPPFVKNASPTPPKKVSLPLPPIEASPPPSKEATPPPVRIKLSPPPPTTFSLPPPPKEVPPPPPPKELSPPSTKQVYIQSPKELFPPPPPTIEVSSLSPPEKAPTPPPEEGPLPTPNEIHVPLPNNKIFMPPPKEAAISGSEETSPLLKAVSATTPPVVSSAPVKVSSLAPKEVFMPSPEETTLLSFQEIAHPEEAAPDAKCIPPPSIVTQAPSQAQSSDREIDLLQDNVGSESETNPVSSISILTPPQNIPLPPPIQPLIQPDVAVSVTDATQETSLSSLSDSIQPTLENTHQAEKEPVPSPPLPLPLPVQGLSSTQHKSSPPAKESQMPELSSAPVLQDESSPIVTPSLLQMVKLRSVNSSPEAPQVPEQPDTEVTMRIKQSSDLVPTSSASVEAPQKPIRRSLIISLPTATSPPATLTSQPSLPKSEALVVPPASASTGLSPTKKSHPGITASPSMNLQEAIRLRTAARSLGPPSHRLSLHSPTSPSDLRKSPSNTASFIFSKSNKKVVIETKPLAGTKAAAQQSQVAYNETESVQKEVKVPPPVAKKPKTKEREIETSEGTEQTAGEEEQRVMGKTNC